MPYAARLAPLLLVAECALGAETHAPPLHLCPPLLLCTCAVQTHAFFALCSRSAVNPTRRRASEERKREKEPQGAKEKKTCFDFFHRLRTVKIWPFRLSLLHRPIAVLSSRPRHPPRAALSPCYPHASPASVLKKEKKRQKHAPAAPLNVPSTSPRCAECRNYGIDVLEMDYENEKDLQWLAYYGLKAPLPPGWGGWSVLRPFGHAQARPPF